MGEREITYGIDKQGKPALLSKKESIAQQIINALFLAEGQIPNLPIGVDVEKYLYSQPSDVQVADIKIALSNACGSQFMTENVESIECGVISIKSVPYFWLSVHLKVDKEEEDTLALVLTRQNDTVTFNYKFLSEGIKKAYNME